MQPQQQPVLPAEPPFRGEGPRDFMRRRLKETSCGWTGKRVDDDELVAPGVGNRFWELVGMRIRGHSSLMLGAVQFRRQSSDVKHARQSLPSYLASDQSKDDVNGIGLPTVVSVEFPTATESVREFLDELSGKPRRNRVLVDKSLIDVVFDLRADNPSVGKLSCPSKRVSRTVVVRTREGHLLSGNLLNLEICLSRELPFIALTMGVQHTVHGNCPLPTLFLHRGFLAMLSVVDEETPLARQLRCTPFQVSRANPMHLVLED